MCCYFRHLSDLFEEAGIEVTKANRRAVNLHLAHAVGVDGTHCPTIWRQVKERLGDPERRAELVACLRTFAG